MARISWFRRGEASDRSTRGHKLRNVVVVAALATLSSGGALVIANSADSATTVVTKVTICHRTNSNSNPYVEITPDVSGVINGHAGHTGPVWDPTLKSMHIKWGDIIPAFDYDDGGTIKHFPGQNTTPAGLQILDNGCNIPNSVNPVNPTVTQSTCVAGSAVDPVVTFPNTPGITYSISPAPTAGGTSTVTATAISPANWFQPPAPAGWTYVDLTHETFSITFDPAPTCTTTVVPEDPTVTQSVCNTDHNPTVPDVTFANTAGITYSIAPAPVAGGSSVVTATATGSNVFVAPPPAGWTFVDAHTETFTINFDPAPNCKTTVAPVAPTVTQSQCVAGTAVDPIVTLATTAGITYSIAPAPTAGGTSVVTATADTGAGDQFVAPAPAGWTFVDAATETFSITFDPAPNCAVPPTTVVPVAPTVTQSVCTGGTPIDPTVTLATTPGITYSISPAPAAGGTSTVTATADAGDQFVAPAPAGWTFVDSSHETFSITFDATPDCTAPASGAVPTAPTVTQASCDNTSVVDPTLTLATTDGIAYTVNAAAPFTPGQSVVVTATSDATHVFSTAPTGWTLVDAHHETFALTFDAAPDCSGSLAATGVNSKLFIEFGGIVLLLGVGFQLIAMGTRRRPTA